MSNYKLKLIITWFLLPLLFTCSNMIEEFDGIEQDVHLFILSGQSNMVAFNPEESFKTHIINAFQGDGVVLVKDAWSGQPIRRWYKDWKPLEGEEPKAQPELYDKLMQKVYQSIQNKNILTVTFIWMHGEADALSAYGNVYEKSLIGLYEQLSDDLQRTDINFVIGRLNDHDLENNAYPDWTLIRDIQMRVGQSNPRFNWINTDDLNDGLGINGGIISNDLHMSVEGYIELGNRFADKTIKLIQSNQF